MDAGDVVDVEVAGRIAAGLHEFLEAVADAEHSGAAESGTNGGRSDHRVDARCGATPHQDAEGRSIRVMLGHASLLLFEKGILCEA
jgi:hypothetical protein